MDTKRLSEGLDRIALAEFTEALRHNLPEHDLYALSELLACESDDRRDAQHSWSGTRPDPTPPLWSEKEGRFDG